MSEPDLALFIPCKPANDKEKNEARPMPSLVTVFGQQTRGYKCPWCTMEFIRYKPCAGHMGLIANHKPSCTGRPRV